MNCPVKRVEKEWQDWHAKNHGLTGYSYPVWQVKKMRETHVCKDCLAIKV